MERYYNIAGVDICISGKDDEMSTDEKILKHFRVEKAKENNRFDFFIVDQLSQPLGLRVYHDSSKDVYYDGETEIRYIGSVEQNLKGAYLRIEKEGKYAKVQVKRTQLNNEITTKVILNALVMEQLIISNCGIILHAAYIDWNGKAILFTAPSGTGKSTQADLWKKYRQAEIINGDRAVVRIIDGKIHAAGIPFAGSSEFCKNQTLPVVAIVYLQQAPVTNIYRMKGMEAFCKVWEGCTVNTWNKEDLSKAVDIVQDVISKVPVFHLACTPDESAVLALEQALKDYEQQSRKEQ